MTVLTFNEGEVVAVVRQQARQGDPVATHTVRMAVWDSHRITYDATNRALSGLVKKGVLVKSSRGNYLPAGLEGRVA